MLPPVFLVWMQLYRLQGPELGSAVYPVVSRLNHSCQPVVVVTTSRTGECEVRTARRVEAGTEVTELHSTEI